MECALIVRCFSRNEGDGVISRGVMFCIGPGIGGADKLGGNVRRERSVRVRSRFGLKYDKMFDRLSWSRRKANTRDNSPLQQATIPAGAQPQLDR